MYYVELLKRARKLAKKKKDYIYIIHKVRVISEIL